MERVIFLSTQGKVYVYKRQGKKKTSYTYCIEVGRNPLTGKRKRTYKGGFRTATEARRSAQKLLNRLLLGKNIIEFDITFSEFASEWLDDRKSSLKLATIYNLGSTIDIANRYFAKVKMKDITPYEYQQFINDYAQKVKYSTLKTRHHIIKSIFNYAVKFNIILNNPTLEAELPKITSMKKDVTDLYLTKEELQDFLCFVKYKRYGGPTDFFYPLCVTLAYTGMRIGEACALTWEDIDFNKKTIFIHSSLFAKNYTFYKKQDTPKNESSIRHIIIGETLATVLQDWKKLQLRLRLKNGGLANKVDKEDYVFTKFTRSNNGKRKEIVVIPNAVRNIFDYMNKKGTYPKHMHAHILRHTHVSLLAETNKISLEAIQERLGHSSDRITREVYLHVTDKTKQNAAKVFEDYINNNGDKMATNLK